MYNVGDYVKVSGTNIEGFILKVAKNSVSILYNDKCVIVKIDDNEIISKEKPKKSNENTKVKLTLTMSTPPEDEIMIRHQTVEEAMENLDKFISSAICNNIKIVKIIHGKQGGVLRKAVHTYLENSPYVKEHRLGGYYEGSYGVTIAFLK